MNQLYSMIPTTMDNANESYSYEGFQPPLDNSQECCPLLPKYDQDERQHESKHNLGKTGNTTSEFKATFYNPFETKHRRRTSRTQFRILEAAFEDNPKPSAAKRQSLAEELSMTPRGVQIWFQNRRAKAKQKLPDESRKRPHEDDHQPRRRNKPFYTEWDSQQPIVTNDGASDGTASLHVTPPSPHCIAGIHPVQAPPPLCYCYSDSSSPVTPSVPSPTLQDPDVLTECPKPIWPIDNAFIPMDSNFYVVDWMDRSLRHEPLTDFRSEQVLPQWSKEQQVASFPSSPSSPLLPQQPVIHTADNKDNSIALARVYDHTPMVDSNFAPVIDVHWLPDHPELITW